MSEYNNSNTPATPLVFLVTLGRRSASVRLYSFCNGSYLYGLHVHPVKTCSTVSRNATAVLVSNRSRFTTWTRSAVSLCYVLPQKSGSTSLKQHPTALISQNVEENF